MILFLSPSYEGGVRGGLFCPHPNLPLVPQSGIYDRGGLLKWRIEGKRITAPFIVWSGTKLCTCSLLLHLGRLKNLNTLWGRKFK